MKKKNIINILKIFKEHIELYKNYFPKSNISIENLKTHNKHHDQILMEAYKIGFVDGADTIVLSILEDLDDKIEKYLVNK